MTVKRAVGAVLSSGASWIQGREGGGVVEIARLSSMKSRSFLHSGKITYHAYGTRYRNRTGTKVPTFIYIGTYLHGCGSGPFTAES